MHLGNLTLATAVLAAGLVGCGSSGASGSGTMGPPGPSPQTATVAATAQLAFSPNAVTIAPGGTVTFAFGTVGHAVKFDTGTNPPGDITGVNANTSISRTFSTAGTYTFHCTIHPQMTGTIIVAASSTTNNPAPPPGYGP
ncbi:MAG: plastocyanin/azurin family copper-binding protein [Gemmatimonadota bacterium]